MSFWWLNCFVCLDIPMLLPCRFLSLQPSCSLSILDAADPFGNEKKLEYKSGARYRNIFDVRPHVMIISRVLKFWQPNITSSTLNNGPPIWKLFCCLENEKSGRFHLPGLPDTWGHLSRWKHGLFVQDLWLGMIIGSLHCGTDSNHARHQHPVIIGTLAQVWKGHDVYFVLSLIKKMYPFCNLNPAIHNCTSSLSEILSTLCTIVLSFTLTSLSLTNQYYILLQLKCILHSVFKEFLPD